MILLRVYYLYYDGSAWSADNELTPIALSNSPAPVEFNGELYVFMQDKNSDNQLWYTSSDGSSWSVMNQVSGASMVYSPACVVFNNQLYCFYNGASGEGGLMYYSRCTTNWSWSAAAPLNTIELSAAPSGVCFNNVLFCLFEDASLLFCLIYDAKKSAWSPPFPLPGVNMIGTASAVAFTPPGSTFAQLYIFYQAAGASGQMGELWYVTYDYTTATCTAPEQVFGGLPGAGGV